MPTYRYRCEKCGDEFEVWQSITDPALTNHDADGGALRKVLSAAGIVLKGSGFYKTDSRSGNGAKRSSPKDSGAKERDSSSKDSGTKDSSSKDSSSKPESKAPDSKARSTSSS